MKFVKYPEHVPKDGDYIFFIYNGFNDITFGEAKTEYTWDNQEGGQVLYSGKETEDEIKDLTNNGYILSHMFLPSGGFSTPHTKFLWCLLNDFGDEYANAYPEDFED